MAEVNFQLNQDASFKGKSVANTIEWMRHTIQKANPHTDVGMRVSQESWVGMLEWALAQVEEYHPELRGHRLDEYLDATEMNPPPRPDLPESETEPLVPLRPVP